ncbi:hypothetical protein CAAN1_16S03378 [[Candida] anglica]|uniref:proline--tRNA ligase n=1 Tax=[Candida] anglica TaxID=148631 RepID=A0ABP0EA55_9ASCO
MLKAKNGPSWMVRYVSHSSKHRVPRLAINSELPKDLTTIPTHELFVKSGFFSHPRPGLVNWMPVGLNVLRKVEQVIRDRMVEVGGEEVNLSSLSSASLWEKTGRWNNTELFKLRDSSGDPYCLAATCEEEITNLVSQQLKSYKDLPQLYFQINKKYRDEKRPRSGLLRGREFIMKDAYSFDIDETRAMETYDKLVGAYYRIFEDLKVPFVKADADTGDIGGSLSHEWHYLHSSAGEDTLFTCDECGNSSNLEKTLSYSEKLEDHLEVEVEYFLTKDTSTLICAYYPRGRTLETNLLKLHIPDIDLNLNSSVIKQEELFKEFKDEELMMSKKVIRVMDARLNQTSNLPDFPVPFINRSFITTMFDTPIVAATEGEICGVCEDGKLSVHKSIEVGHTFFLGDKYTKPLNLTVEVPPPADATSKKMIKQNVVMGCYGIGVSRIIAAMGEILKDSQGFRWPKSIAPWTMTVVEARGFESIENADSCVYNVLDKLETELEGFNYKVDERSGVGLGKKIKESNMLGIPLSLIVGKKFPLVEIEVRGKRFTKEPVWRKLYQEKKEEFQWEVNEEKHIVHIDAVGEVVKTLLEDM